MKTHFWLVVLMVGTVFGADRNGSSSATHETSKGTPSERANRLENIEKDVIRLRGEAKQIRESLPDETDYLKDGFKNVKDGRLAVFYLDRFGNWQPALSFGRVAAKGDNTIKSFKNIVGTEVSVLPGDFIIETSHGKFKTKGTETVPTKIADDNQLLPNPANYDLSVLNPKQIEAIRAVNLYRVENGLQPLTVEVNRPKHTSVRTVMFSPDGHNQLFLPRSQFANRAKVDPILLSEEAKSIFVSPTRGHLGGPEVFIK